MNTTLLLGKIRKELALARAQAVQHQKTARLAWHTARAAKLKLKQAKKLTRLAKKSARKADDESELSLEISERLQAKLEKLEKRSRKEQPNGRKSFRQLPATRKKIAAARRSPISSTPPKSSVAPLTVTPTADVEFIDDGSDAFHQLPPIRPSTAP